jgi:ABC-type transport system involved in multi-copper enzyme maturation permease subunit
MWKTLLFKELRETAWITLPALAVYAFFIFDTMRVPLLPEPFRSVVFMGLVGRTGDIPFVSARILEGFGWITVLSALALGFWQTLGEERQGTYPVLLHMPMLRRRIVAAKLACGLGFLALVGAAVLLILALWAGTPGTHPSPFAWSMTWPSWGLWLGTSLVYLGAFLSGLWPGRWFGTRLLPVGTAVILMVILQVSPLPALLWAATWICASAGFLLAIDHVAHVRDYS